MWTIKQHRGKENIVSYQSCLTVNILEQWIWTVTEHMVPEASCSLLMLTKNTVSEFSLVLLQTTKPDHLNSAIQGLCQCAWVSLFQVQVTFDFLLATPVENISHVGSLLTFDQPQNIHLMVAFTHCLLRTEYIQFHLQIQWGVTD